MALRDFPSLRYVNSREDFLVEASAGKRVLHIGCADAIHMAEHAKHGRLLHPRIEASAKHTVGVDLDPEAISRLREFCKGELRVGDAENLQLADSEKFDLIIGGEIIEHLNNPGNFLTGVQRYLADGGQLILTTPNSLSLKTFIFALFGIQRVHHDHTLAFTFSLLETLANRHGWKTVEWVTCPEIFPTSRNAKSNLVFGCIYRWMPRLADTICVRLIRTASAQA